MVLSSVCNSADLCFKIILHSVACIGKSLCHFVEWGIMTYNLQQTRLDREEGRPWAEGGSVRPTWQDSLARVRLAAGGESFQRVWLARPHVAAGAWRGHGVICPAGVLAAG